MHPVLQFLHALLAHPQQLGNNTQQAHQYAAHPEQFVGNNAVDPAQFGYPADISGANIHVNQPYNFGSAAQHVMQPNVGFGPDDNPQNGLQDPQIGNFNQSGPMAMGFDMQGPNGRQPQFGRPGAGMQIQGGNNAYGQSHPINANQRLRAIQQAFSRLR